MRTARIIALLVLLCTGALFCQGNPPPLPSGVRPGAISIPSSEFSLIMTSESGKYFSVDSKSRRVELPPGKYSIIVLRLRKKDNAGREWSLSSKALNRPILLREGKTTTLLYGEPLAAEVKRSGDIFSFELTGAFKESYTYFSLKDARLAAPSFTITGPTGKVLEKGQFKFG